MPVIDASHPIMDQSPCTFGTVNHRPTVSYYEGEAHGISFITSKIDNLYSNTCTHVDFPGHLVGISENAKEAVGAYPLERFIGKVLIVDVSKKLEAIRPFFSSQGVISISPGDNTTLAKFLASLENLAISEEEIQSVLASAKDDIKGILFYTGLSSYWQYRPFQSWQYIYFFSPFLSTAACQVLANHKMSFVGVDSFQLEDPIVNFRGDELIVVLDSEGRRLIRERLDMINVYSNHHLLLGNDILIYENLKIPVNVVGTQCGFSGPPLNLQVDGLNDNALVRPYLIV